MAGALILIALIGAGVYTGNVGFYWAAGGSVALVFLFQIFVIGLARKAFKSVDKGFDNFGGLGDFKRISGRSTRDPFNRR